MYLGQRADRESQEGEKILGVVVLKVSIYTQTTYLQAGIKSRLHDPE